MPQTAIGNIGLNYEWDLGSDGWKNGMDHNLILLDTLGQGYVIDHTVTAEPGAPVIGAAYILASTQTGTNWGTDGGAIEDAVAIYTNISGAATPWTYLTPREGWLVYERTQNAWHFFDGSNWIVDGHLKRRVVKLADTAGVFEPDKDNHANAEIIFTDAYDDANDALNIPDNATQPFTIGTEMHFFNDGDGDVSVTDDMGVTWLGEDFSTIIMGVGSRVSIRKTAADEWTITHLHLEGTHNTDMGGFAADPNVDIKYFRDGKTISLHCEAITAITSDAVTMAIITALPVFLRPSIQFDLTQVRVIDSGTNQVGFAQMPTSGLLAYFATELGGAFTASGNKGINSEHTFTYPFS